MSYITDQVNQSLRDIDREPFQQIMYLYNVMESKGTSPEDKRWLSRKIKSIRDFINNPTPRQRVVGIRSGSPSKIEQKMIDQVEILDRVKSHIAESYVR